MKPVLPFFALLALSPFAAAQTPVNANTAYELPSLAPIDGKADHETIAVNSNGDVLIVWSASVYSLSSAESAVRRVECAFLRRTSATTWSSGSWCSAQRQKAAQPPAGTAAPKKVEVGIYLGHLLKQPRAGIPTVACVLLSQQEAAEAATQGVAVAYAR